MKLDLLQPTWAARFPDLVVGQTTRAGGVSRAPWGSLNFSTATGDRPAEVQKNHAILAEALGFKVEQLAGGRQVHGRAISEVQTGGRYDGHDAFVTAQDGLLLGVTAADCVPILLVEPERRIVAAVHAGWRGTVAEVVRRTVDHIRENLAGEPARYWAFIGAAIGFDDYEVGLEVAEHFATDFRRGPDLRGKYFVDLKGANRTQLIAAGLRPEQIEVSPVSTLQSSDRFFSHRAAGGQPTGRGLAVIGYRKRKQA